MAADPAARYASVAELGADVARYLDGLPVTAYPETWLDKASRFLAWHRTWVILLLTLPGGSHSCCSGRGASGRPTRTSLQL